MIRFLRQLPPHAWHDRWQHMLQAPNQKGPCSNRNYLYLRTTVDTQEQQQFEKSLRKFRGCTVITELFFLGRQSVKAGKREIKREGRNRENSLVFAIAALIFCVDSSCVRSRSPFLMKRHIGCALNMASVTLWTSISSASSSKLPCRGYTINLTQTELASTGAHYLRKTSHGRSSDSYHSRSNASNVPHQNLVMFYICCLLCGLKHSSSWPVCGNVRCQCLPQSLWRKCWDAIDLQIRKCREIKI